MKRFFDRIAKKALDPRQPSVVICALGDSVTQGVMEHRWLDPSATYLRRLQIALEEFFPTTTFNTLNAGVSGDQVTGGLERLDRDVIQHQPDLVLLAFGLNDCLKGISNTGEFGKTLTKIVGRLQNETEADIVLVTPPFMATRAGSRVHPEHSPFAGDIARCQNDGTLAAYAEIIRQVSSREKLALADVHAEWKRLQKAAVDTDLWLSNGLNHPDARGHQLPATVIFHALLSGREQPKA